MRTLDILCCRFDKIVNQLTDQIADRLQNLSALIQCGTFLSDLGPGLLPEFDLRQILQIDKAGL